MSLTPHTMGEKSGISKARQELEDLYLGVPDVSVDLTFKDLASFQQKDTSDHEEEEEEKRKMELIREESVRQSKSIVARSIEEEPGREQLSRRGSRAMADSSLLFDDAGGGRRRRGIPHSIICALCSESIYIFRHRCLVCGRVYCRKCVGAGMGEMTEGRKCVECLGRRFSQRYIRRVGQTGCCWGYSSTVKQQELKWAEKGPRRSGEREYGRSGTASRSRSPMISRNPTTKSNASMRSRSPMMSRNPTNRSNVSMRSRSPVMSRNLATTWSHTSGSSPMNLRTPGRSHDNDNTPSFTLTSPAYSPIQHGFPL